MAGTGFFALLDDVTSILDDVATMSKVAAQKTSAIAGDDLAVNAEGLVGLDPSRELPVIGKVALGSALNKLVLIPLALVLPSSVLTPLLMIGGTYLCYEGVHKVLHRKGPHDEEDHQALLEAAIKSPADLQKFEAKKVKQAIVTDIVLSAEIVAIALAAVAEEPFPVRAGVLVVVGFGMTVAIYGLVAGIVKLDDIGLHLQRAGGPKSLKAALGRVIIEQTPRLLKLIAVLGTVAMFLVGGGIILHGIPGAEAALAQLLESRVTAGWLRTLVDLLSTLGVGIVTGLAALLVVSGVKPLAGRLINKKAPAT